MSDVTQGGMGAASARVPSEGGGKGRDSVIREGELRGGTGHFRKGRGKKGKEERGKGSGEKRGKWAERKEGPKRESSEGN